MPRRVALFVAVFQPAAAALALAGVAVAIVNPRQVRDFAKATGKLAKTDRIDRDAAWPLKREALRVLFDAGLTGQRAASFEAFCAREGEGLTTFATWCALGEVHGLPWTDWPAELHDPA